jgi:hydroxyethylthiazole kinase-like uncharacterized protein yjeF
MTFNNPDLWINTLPVRNNGHKYDYGHAFIYGAPEMTGASRLAASACARMGAGLVSVLCANEAYNIYRTTLPSHIIVQNDLKYKHDKLSARLYGSGGLPCKPDFEQDIPTVLDAEALKYLPDRLSSNYILTPHDGEFAKTFPDIKGDKQKKALVAASQTNAIIVLKGAETIIAHPDRRVVTNHHSSPMLASGGTGDVLAGMITGLLAQGMDPFHAACAAVWIHGEAGLTIGHGLVASDIEAILPKILTMLINSSEGENLGYV